MGGISGVGGVGYVPMVRAAGSRPSGPSPEAVMAGVNQTADVILSLATTYQFLRTGGVSAIHAVQGDMVGLQLDARA